MNLKMKLSIVLALSCVAAACTSGNPVRFEDKKETRAAPAKTVIRVDTEAPEITPLETKNLPAGKCGTLLWTLEAGKPVMIFRAVREEGAEMIIDGSPTSLTLLSQSGEQRYGMATEQRYTTGNGIQVSITGAYGQAFPGGAYLEDGLITLTNVDGWERVNPVAGLAGCRN